MNKDQFVNLDFLNHIDTNYVLLITLTFEETRMIQPNCENLKVFQFLKTHLDLT